MGRGRSGPNEHRDRGAKVMSRISGESEPPVRRASESLSVQHFCVNSDEHDAKHGVMSGPGQQAPPRACEQGGASSSARSTEEKQRGDVKRAGASARTSEHDRASACQQA